jgi:hypothetical protein
MRYLIGLLCAGMLSLNFFSLSYAAGDLTILYTGNTYGEYAPCPS